MNEHPVLYAETASDLRSDISKIGAALCLFIPLCSVLASLFVSTYTNITGTSSVDAFMESDFYYVYMFVLSLIPISLCILALNLFFRRKLSVIMLKPTVNRKDFSLLTLVGMVSIPLGSIVSAMTAGLMESAGLKIPETTVPNGVLPIIFFFLSHVIVAPIFEEILFRSIILERLRRYGDVFAIIVSATLFAFMHSSLHSIPFAFVSGIIFGLLAVLSGSSLASMIVHFANNLLSTISLVCLANGYGNSFSLILIAIYCVIIITAIICFSIIKSSSPSLFSLGYGKGILKTSRKLSLFFGSFTIIIFFIMSLWLTISSATAV